MGSPGQRDEHADGDRQAPLSVVWYRGPRADAAVGAHVDGRHGQATGRHTMEAATALRLRYRRRRGCSLLPISQGRRAAAARLRSGDRGFAAVSGGRSLRRPSLRSASALADRRASGRRHPQDEVVVWRARDCAHLRRNARRQDFPIRGG